MEVTRNNVAAHVVGGFLVGMMMIARNGLLTKGSEIHLKQKIVSKTYCYQQVLKDNLGEEFLQKIAKVAYSTIVEIGEKQEFTVNPITFIESIAFDFEKELVGFYGNNIMELVSRVSMKNEHGAADSYKFADEVKVLFRKKLYDVLKEIEWKK